MIRIAILAAAALSIAAGAASAVEPMFDVQTFGPGAPTLAFTNGDGFPPTTIELLPGSCLRGPLNVRRGNDRWFSLAHGADYPAGCARKAR